MILAIVLFASIVGIAVLAVFLAMLFRIVVSTNEVHIVQSGEKTVSYGKDQPSGNCYYRWPSWVPKIGVKTIVLPVSVFDVALSGYDSYDKGRLPFVVDVMAFFRVTDSNSAAQRVHSIPELKEQLQAVLQGSVRAILAQSEIEEIMEGRGKFGEMFTKEVDHNLESWGVQTVKCIELMDLRDSKDSKVIHNIMAKKKSKIEMESRMEVAKNLREAETAEIAAKQAVAVRDQEAKQAVGQREAEQQKQVGIAREQASQEVKAQERETMTREMAIKEVAAVRAAEIEKAAKVVAAEQARQTQVIDADAKKQTSIIQAEGTKQMTVTIAEGNLSQAQLHAQGIEAEGKAKGVAEQAVLMAPVNSQIALAKEIGENQGYQQYLVTVRTIEKDQAVGVAQAQALTEADIKVIANSGDIVSGVSNLTDLFTSKGGSQIGAMLEGIKQTPAGAALLKRFNGNGETAGH